MKSAAHGNNDWNQRVHKNVIFNDFLIAYTYEGKKNFLSLSPFIAKKKL